MTDVTSIKHRFLIENPKRKKSRRLGWHQKIDPRNAQHTVKAHLESLGQAHLLSAPLVTKLWKRTLKPLNQGNLGSCTGNAICGLLATEPNNKDGISDDVKITEKLAQQVYSKASQIDDIHGDWPPTDTGSTGLDALRAAKALGFIAGYKHCTNAQEALQVLSHIGPIAIGTDWLAGMDTPKGKNKVLAITGKNEGGHEYEVLGIDVENNWVEMINSWGSSWGLKGRARIMIPDFLALIDKLGGDAVLILPPTR